MTPENSAELVELRPALLKYALFLCRNVEDAADLCGETVCRVMERIHLHGPDDNGLKGYCKAVMLNVFINATNRRKLWNQFAETCTEQTTDGTDAAHDYNLMRKICNKPEVILMAAGYTCKEIAAARQIPVATVRTRIHNERARLAGILDYNANQAKPRKRRGRPPKKRL